MPVNTRSASGVKLEADKKADRENAKPGKTKSDKKTKSNEQDDVGKAKSSKKTTADDAKSKKSDKQGKGKTEKTKSDKKKKPKTKEPDTNTVKPAPKPAPKPISFRHHYLNAYDEMYVNHERLRPSQQWEMASDVASEIEDSLALIAAQTKPDSHYLTKFSAIETMRGIFTLFLDGTPGEIPRVVRQNVYGWGEHLMTVVETFSEEELDRLCVERVGEKGLQWLELYVKMADMADMAQGGIAEDLKTEEALQLLVWGAKEEDGTHDWEEDDTLDGEEDENMEDVNDEGGEEDSEEEWQGFSD